LAVQESFSLFTLEGEVAGESDLFVFCAKQVEFFGWVLGFGTLWNNFGEFSFRNRFLDQIQTANEFPVDK
jgi:hypothetical protein